MANKDLAMKQRQAAMKRSEKNAPSQPQSTSPARADRVRSGGQTTLVTDNKKKKVVESGVARQMIKKLAKIDTLPKTVSESIPIRGVMPAGIIETAPGTFTKSYLLHDVSFSIATEQEQFQIFNAFASFLNTFNEKTRWQFNIYNHEINKKRTMANIRIAAQKDGLNPYRQEMNNVLLDNLKMGNNSIKQDKILTVAIDDINAEHAVSVLRRMDAEI